MDGSRRIASLLATLRAPNQWMEIRLEELAASPEDVSAKVYSFAGMEPETHTRLALADVLANPVYAGKTGTSDAEVQSLAPGIADQIGTAGYRLVRDGERWVAMLSEEPSV